MKTLLLKKEEVRQLISMKDVIGAVEEAYKGFNSDQVVQPDYIGIDLHPPRGDIDFKPESTAKFKADIESEFGIPVVMANSKKEAVEQADILITTTRGKGSVVEAGWVKPGTHIVAIGTDAKGKQEFDPEIFRNAKAVVDSILQCSEKGEIQHALRENILTKDGIFAEIGEVLLGKKPGRESDEEITIFDSTGMAIQDNTTSTKIYRNAIENKVGTFFEFFE